MRTIVQILDNIKEVIDPATFPGEQRESVIFFFLSIVICYLYVNSVVYTMRRWNPNFIRQFKA